MKEEQYEKIAKKLADVLNEEKPRPDIIDCIKILHKLEESFLELLF